MGLGNFLGKVAHAGSKVLGGVGGVVKKVAHFTAPVIRKVGAFAKPVAEVAAGIGAAFGHPEFAKAMQGVAKVADTVHTVAPKVEKVVAGAGVVGSKMQSVGEKLGTKYK
jgi:hypothetical protein